MRRTVLGTLVAWLTLLALGVTASAAGLRINVSPSVPRGFYLLTSRPPTRGGYVSVCPPPAAVFDHARARGYLGPGSCEGNYSEMIKVLAAEPGERVRIGPEGVHVGERLWPGSKPLTVDAAGRALPAPRWLRGRLDGDSVLVMSQDCVVGFDGRYFGPLPRSSIRAAAVPLLTW